MGRVVKEGGSEFICRLNKMSAKLQYAAAGGVALSLQNRKTFERHKTCSYKFIPVKFAERTDAVFGFRQRCDK